MSRRHDLTGVIILGVYSKTSLLVEQENTASKNVLAYTPFQLSNAVGKVYHRNYFLIPGLFVHSDI